MRSFPPEAEGVEEFVVNTLHDLADTSYPTPQAFRPNLASSVAFGRADEPCLVALEPAAVVICPLKAFVDHVGYRGGRTCAPEPGVRSGSQREEGFAHLLIGGGGGPKTEACDHPGRIDSGKQAEALIPAQAVRPPDVGIAGQPARTPALGIPDGHRRGVQSLVGVALSRIQHYCQVHAKGFDESYMGTYQPVELGAVGQGGEGVSKVACGIAVEVVFAGESGPPGEDGEGNDLAFGEGGLRTRAPFWRMGLADVVNHD